MTTEQARRIVQELKIRRYDLYAQGRENMSKALEDVIQSFRLEHPALLQQTDEDFEREYLAQLHADLLRDERVLSQKRHDINRIEHLTSMIERERNDISIPLDVRNIRIHAFTQVLEHEKIVFSTKWGKA